MKRKCDDNDDNIINNKKQTKDNPNNPNKPKKIQSKLSPYSSTYVPRHIVFIPETLPIINNLTDLIKIGNDIKVYKNINMLHLWKITPYLIELNNLIGMKNLKETIFLQVLYYLQGLHLGNNEEYLHTIITGSPGSGKTTVAKIISNIYLNMGILWKDLTIASRDDLIAGYVGQTAIKTKALLKSCLGGVLFIDEAYSMGSGDKDKVDSFSKEAVDILNQFLSENKNNFCCIIAGYEEDIKKCFFSINKGLERRFQWIHRIEEYKSNELTEIFIGMVKKIGWETTVDSAELIKLFEVNKDLFKNAGGSIENYISKCKIYHSKRVFGLDVNVKFILDKKDLTDALDALLKHKLYNDEEDLNTSYKNMYM